MLLVRLGFGRFGRCLSRSLRGLDLVLDRLDRNLLSLMLGFGRWQSVGLLSLKLDFRFCYLSGSLLTLYLFLDRLDRDLLCRSVGFGRCLNIGLFGFCLGVCSGDIGEIVVDRIL